MFVKQKSLFFLNSVENLLTSSNPGTYLFRYLLQNLLSNLFFKNSLNLIMSRRLLQSYTYSGAPKLTFLFDHTQKRRKENTSIEMSSPGFCLIHSGVPFYEISLPTSVAQRYEVDRENQKDLSRLLITFSGFFHLFISNKSCYRICTQFLFFSHT